MLAFVVFFYLLGALYDDRKDRSILFWKSLPASDTLTIAIETVFRNGPCTADFLGNLYPDADRDGGDCLVNGHFGRRKPLDAVPVRG